MGNFFIERYRSWPADMVKGPCHIRSAGHYKVEPGFRGTSLRKEFFELFWTVSGCGHFLHKGTVFDLPEGKIFCYLPGDCHNVSSGGNHWEYCWLTLDGENLEKLIGCFGFQRQVQDAGPCPSGLFDDLCDLIVRVDTESACNALSTTFRILTRAANPVQESENNSALRFQEMAAKEYSKTDFSVEEAAIRLKVHRSSLHRTFRRTFGLSPKEYLQSFRIRQAVNLLQDGHSIKEIAEKCGFSDVNYFTKAFRKQMGKPPAEFRENMLLDTR